MRVAALVVLARLDNVVIVALVVGWCFFRWRSTRLAALAIGTAAVLVSPYVLWHSLAFGHFLPVSATVKQELVRQAVAPEFGSRFTIGYLLSVAGSVGDYLQGLARACFGSGPLGLLLTLSLPDRPGRRTTVASPAAHCLADSPAYGPGRRGGEGRG